MTEPQDLCAARHGYAPGDTEQVTTVGGHRCHCGRGLTELAEPRLYRLVEGDAGRETGPPSKCHSATVVQIIVIIGARSLSSGTIRTTEEVLHG